jgi:phosphatidylglycerophosphatase A
MTNRIAQFATLFGIGRMPFAPGTAASFIATIVAVPIAFFLGAKALFVLAIATALFGIWVSGAYERATDRHDPQDCVIDEAAGQWLACAFAPLSPVGYALAFVLFRLFDVAKPWPISKAEHLKGGVGIVADDMLAGLIAGVVVYLFSFSGFL